MHKLADIIAFLFLSTLISVTGLVIITVQAQTNSGTGAPNQFLNSSNNTNSSGSPIFPTDAGRLPQNNSSSDLTATNNTASFRWSTFDAVNPDNVEYRLTVWNGTGCGASSASGSTSVYRTGTWGEDTGPDSANYHYLDVPIRNKGDYSWKVEGRISGAVNDIPQENSCFTFSNVLTATNTNTNANSSANTNGNTNTNTNTNPVTNTNSVDVPPPPDQTNTNTNSNSNVNTNANTNANTNSQTDITPTPGNLETYRVQSKNLSRSELIGVSLQANAAINVWTVRITEGTAIYIESDTSNPKSLADIKIGDTIAIFGTRNATAQSILADVINVELPDEPGTTTVTPPPSSSTGAVTDEPVTDEPPVDEPVDSADTDTGETSQIDTPVTRPTPPPPSTDTSFGGSGNSGPIVSDPVAVQTQRVQQYCVDRGITDTVKCNQLIERNLDPICRVSGITSITRCQEFMKEVNLERFCVNRDSLAFPLCEDFVVETVSPRLTCGSLPNDECVQIVKTNLVGDVVTKVERAERVKQVIEDRQLEYTNTRELIAAVNQDTEEEEDVDPTEISSLDEESETPLVILPAEEVVDVSSSVIAAVALPYISAIDTDSDGLPDDLERFYKTSVSNPDTDNDGFSDFDEVKNDYDPLSPGGEKIGRVLTPVELAILNRERVQQPIARGEVDEKLVTQSVVANEREDGFILSGTAEPSTRVLVYIYSRLPLVLTVQADQTGNWTYELADQLSEGDHTVYVAITDEKGVIEKKSNPLSFLIQGAQAITVSDFLDEQSLQENQWVTDTSSETQFFIYYVLGGIGVIVVGLVGVLLISRTRRQHNV